jgi:hypothetical protein
MPIYFRTYFLTPVFGRRVAVVGQAKVGFRKVWLCEP